MTLRPDLLVIGGGSGGLSIAAGAAQMGAEVVLLEGHKMGGDCLNYGCVPSKALLAAGKHAHAMGSGEVFGVAAAEAKIDAQAVHDHVHGVIAGIAPHDSVERFEGLGVRVIEGFGRFTAPDTVQVDDVEIRARRIVIATGSRPFVPPIPGLDEVPYLTNETLFDLTERPEHLLIIGGGPIGVEMAQANRRLGSAVTVIEGDRVLGRDDPEMSAVVLDQLRAEGIDIVEGAMVERIEGTAGAITVYAGGKTYAGTHLLIAVGRVPALDRLELQAGNVAHDRNGVTVDAGLRSTTNRRVYAVGDAAGGLQFTHVAGYHAGVVIRSALFGLPAKASDAHIPRVTYTTPEIAQVGLPEAEAREVHGDRLEVLRFPYAENDRARAERATTGLIKVMVVKGRPVGTSIVGAQAGELIGTWALALSARLKIGAIANMVAPYPTLGELNKRAAGQYYAPRLFQNAWVKRFVRLVQRF